MAQSRTNLNNPANSSSYIVLTIIFLLLSAGGVFLFFQLTKTKSLPIVSQNQISTPTKSLPAGRQGQILTPTSQIPTISQIPTPTSPATPTIVPEFLTYENSADGFSITYSSARKLYPDTEASGNRYTFYHQSGNIALHTGTQWSWVYPERNFTNTLTISGRPTFRYDIANQTIVDVETGDRKYTIQCVHNGLDSLKTECEAFIKSFKLL